MSFCCFQFSVMRMSWSIPLFFSRVSSLVSLEIHFLAPHMSYSKRLHCGCRYGIYRSRSVMSFTIYLLLNYSRAQYLWSDSEITKSVVVAAGQFWIRIISMSMALFISRQYEKLRMCVHRVRQSVSLRFVSLSRRSTRYVCEKLNGTHSIVATGDVALLVRSHLQANI